MGKYGLKGDNLLIVKIGKRLLRAFATLILFQFILFWLIQIVNQELPVDIQKLELAFSSRENLSKFQSDTSSDTDVAIDIEISDELDTSIESEAIDEVNVDNENASNSVPIIDQNKLPWWREFIGWMTAFYRGDLGESGSTPVVDILKTKLPRTLILLIPGTIGGFMLGLSLGKRVAWRKRGWIEIIATLGGTIFSTSFAPWLAFVMIAVFGLSLNWFPPEKWIDPILWAWADIELNIVITWLLVTILSGLFLYLILAWFSRNFAHKTTIWWRIIGGVCIVILISIPWLAAGYWKLAVDLLRHMVLPVSTLMLLSFGETMLVMKATMTEVVDAEHVKSARARGLPDARVRDRHAARVAILPVLTRFVVYLPVIIVGDFVVEHFFYLDGMGQELIRAANEKDLPVLLGVLSLVAIGILLAHTIFDILTTWLDPRLRDPEETQDVILVGKSI